MKALLITFAVAASLATTVVAAEDSNPAATPEAVPAPVSAPASRKDPNERVCKTTPVIGSRVPSRVCMTRGQWEERAKADRADLEAAQRSGLATCGTKPCS